MIRTAWRWAQSHLCPPSWRKSYALHQLDFKLARYLPKRGGVFIEAGANDGISQSNTLFFERYRGWTGLLVEPVPELAARCRVNRPRCRIESCALVGADSGLKQVTVKYLGLMSQIPGAAADQEAERQHEATARRFLAPGQQPYEVQAPARTLSEVWEAHQMGRVDLLSLDVEGYEAQVLDGLDLERHRPDFIMVEVRDEAAIRRRLDHRYRLVDVLNTTDEYRDMLFTVR